MPGDIKQLLILRHAKSSREDPGLADHDRPLAPRGRRATKAVAGYLRRARITPMLVLCSSARRAQETLEGVGPAGQWMVEPELYAAGAEDLLERLRRVPEEVPSVIMIGHNPAMHMLVVSLAGEEALVDKFPTGALAILELSCAWSQLGPGRARLADFIRPKDLE